MDSYEVLIKPFLESITIWREQGASITQISRKLGISPATMCSYMRKHEELYSAWYDGSIGLVLDLEDTIYKEAKGYKYTETTTTILEDKDGNVYGKKTTTTQKVHFPQIPALQKALEVLHSQRWVVQEDKLDREINILLEGELKDYAE